MIFATVCKIIVETKDDTLLGYEKFAWTKEKLSGMDIRIVIIFSN